MPIQVDCDFPGGNILLDSIDGDVIHLRPDFRDTEGAWFYWCFRITGAASRTLTFHLTYNDPKAKRGCIGARGPALSLDQGLTWQWLGLEDPTHATFSYTFPENCAEARFSVGMTYTQRHLDKFLQSLPPEKISRHILCHSKKSRPVETLHLGNPAAPRALVITARQHCCEMMTSYVVEGILESFLADPWFQQNVEAFILPFADKDGVEDGDQGKNRKPRDHNRDYDQNSVHPEPAAMQRVVPPWLNHRPFAFLDLHCPWLYGGINEKLYQVGQPSDLIWNCQRHFGQVLESVRTGPIPYRAADDLPFGQGWNVISARSQGPHAASFGGSMPHCLLASSLEVPYATANNTEVNPASCHALGHDLATAFHHYLQHPPLPNSDR